MTTATEIITDALDELVAAEEEATLDDALAQSAVRKLNRMMFSLPVETGFTRVTALNQTLSVAPDVEDFMVTNLAKVIAPSLGKSISDSLRKSARRAYRNLLIRYVKVEPMGFPSNFPLGTGNYSSSLDGYAGGNDADREVTEISSNYTLLATDDLVMVDCSDGPVTVTLLAASSYDGYGFSFEKVDDTPNMVILSPAGTDKIRNASDLRFNNHQQRETLYSDGSNWL